MQDYLRALQLRFTPPPNHKAIEEVRKALVCSLLKESRRLLVRLMDLEGEAREQDTLRSFTEGLKLGLGLMSELREDGFYSFESEEEQKACQALEEELYG